MSNEVITRDEQGHASLPFGNQAASAGAGMSPSLNIGAVAIEQQRAIAEAQGKLILANKFPRNLSAAHAELMDACRIPAFAAQAFYSVPNRGSGPSIRFAEEVARVYGHMEYGHRELSRDDDKSEVEVYAWDMQKNNFSRRQITVKHVLDTQYGPKTLKNQTDIDNRIANVASKQMRGRILALVPKWMVAEAVEVCKATLAGNSEEPVSVRVRKMTQAFAKFGVTVNHIERYLDHSLDETTVDELVELVGVFNAIRDGAKPSEYFGDAEKEQQDAEAEESLRRTAEAGRKRAAPAQKQAEKPEEAEPKPTSKAAPAAKDSKPAKNDSKPAEETRAEPAEKEAPAQEPKGKAAKQPEQEAPAPATEPAPEPEQPAEQQADEDQEGAPLF